MRYMAMIFTPDQEIASAYDQTGLDAEYSRFVREAQRAGVLASHELLQSDDTATLVQMTDRGTLISDGPQELPDQAARGFCILDCENLDVAIEWASRIPHARFGTVEVRPVIEVSEQKS